MSTINGYGGPGMPIAEYNADVPADIQWIAEPFVYSGGVTLVSGPPKKGKSTLIAHLLRCREMGGLFLGYDVRRGPTFLLTEESGVAVRHKTNGLERLCILDRRTAFKAGLNWAGVLQNVREWAVANPNGLAIIDSLAVWADIENENDASQVTRALAPVMDLAGTADLGIILVHHVRKSGGQGGEAIRGSGAMLAGADISAELSVVTVGSDDRWLSLQGRIIFPERMRLEFNRATATYSIAQPKDIHRDVGIALELVPPDGPGLTRVDLGKLWGVADPRKKISHLLGAGRLRVNPAPIGAQTGNDTGPFRRPTKRYIGDGWTGVPGCPIDPRTPIPRTPLP